MSSRKHGRNAFESGLNGSITAGATAIDLDSATGLTAPGYLTLAPDDPAKREFILYTGINTNQLTAVSRGLAGSASGAQAHDSGTIARMTFAHQLLDDIWTDIEALEADVAGHVGGTDTADHPEATTSVRGFLSGADKTKLDSLPSGPLTESDISDLDHYDTADFTTDLAAGSILEAQISDLDHTDTDAFHDDVAGEISALTSKSVPVPADHLLIEDSAAGNAKRRATLAALIASIQGETFMDNIADVTISAIAAAEILAWDGAAFINRTLAEAGISAVGHAHAGADITSGTVAIARLPTSTSQTSTSDSFVPTVGTANEKLKAHTGTGSTVIVSTGAPSGGQNGDVWLRV